MSTRHFTILVAALYIAEAQAPAFGTQVEHQFAPIEWSFQGKPIPETYWSPWLPLGAQQVTRLQFGFRFSSGTIAAKCPVKLTFTYDPANAKSGRDLPITVKAQMCSADYNTFESAFGIALPNKLQIGFFGISGLPDFLPWWDLPWDFWDLLGSLPIPEAGGVNIPAMLESAKNNIGVNTGSTDPLPLGTTKSYHDQRSLISFDMTDIAKKYKDQLAPEIFNKLSSALGADDMDDLLTIVQFAKNFGSEEQAVEFVTDLCGDAVEKLASFASLALEGDPYFSVEGVRLRVQARCFIPGGKGSGVYTLYFTSSGQVQTLNFRDITPFVDMGDVLKVVVDEIAYEFRLRQGLTAVVKLSIVPINLDNVEKVVSYTQAVRSYTEGDFKLEIPLSKSDELIQSLRVHPGYVSASVNWASPNVPLKGTVRTYDGQTLVKTTEESEFKNAHNVIVTDLSPSKTYRFAVECLTPTGLTVQGGEKTATTVSTASTRKDQIEVETVDKDGHPAGMFKLSNESAAADYTYIDFAWQTNLAASTMVLISPSSDLAVNYVACAKKTDGSVSQGWVTRDAAMVIETGHQIRISGLEQGVTYYYNILSWQYTDNDPTKDPIIAVGKVGQITTKFAAPPVAKAKVQCQNQPAADVPVVVTNLDNASFRMTLVSDAAGLTPLVTFEKSKRYKFSVKDHPFYLDADSSIVTVGASASGALPDAVIQLAGRPSPGGYVYDAQGSPLNGATVKTLGGSSRQTMTDAQGHYSFTGFTSAGDVVIEASKTGYATRQTAGRVAQCGLVRLFSADNCILPGAVMGLEITVKKLDGTAINGIAVAIKEATTSLGTATTNAQGKATFSHNFNDNNAGSHSLTVAIQPSDSSKILPTSASLSVIGGEQRKVDLNCPEDTQGPVIGSPIVTRPTSPNLQVAFATNEDAVWSVESTDPKGVKRNSSWTKTYARSGIVAVALNAGGGIYKMKVMAKDRLDNASESSVVEYLCVGADQWNLKVGAVDRSMASVTWNKYPNAAEFKSYRVAVVPLIPGTGAPAPVGRQEVTLTDIGATSAKFSNLRQGLTHQVTVQAEIQAGTLAGERASATFTTKSTPPQIRNLQVTPTVAGKGQSMKVTAMATDSDSSIKKLEILYKSDKGDKTLYEGSYVIAVGIPIDESFAVTTPGKYQLCVVASDETGPGEADATFEVLDAEQPRVELTKVPTGTIYSGDEVALEAKLLNAGKIAGSTTCEVNWGDGKTQQITLGETGGAKKAKSKIKIDAIEEEKPRESIKNQIALSHKYEQAGSFTISLVVSTKPPETKATLTSDLIATTVDILPYVPPTVNVTDTTTDSRSNNRTLHILATRGSYPIESWTLAPGGARGESGSGNVNKDVACLYPVKGDFDVKLTVRDARGTEVTGGAHVRIYSNAAPVGGSGQLQQAQGGQTLQSRPDALPSKPTKPGEQSSKITGDLSVTEVTVPDTARVGRAVVIEVAARNDSQTDLNGVALVLLAGTQPIGSQKVDIKAGQTAKATFQWTPPKAATYTLRARIEIPANFEDTNSRNNLLTQRMKAE